MRWRSRAVGRCRRSRTGGAIRARLAILLAAALVAIAAAPVQTPAPPLKPPSTCATVPAHKWNHLVRLERKLDGHSAHRIRHKPICSGPYKAFKRHVKRVRADCLRRVYHPTFKTRQRAGVTGSSFYGYGDSGGIYGACHSALLARGRPGGAYLLAPSNRNTFAVLGSGDVRSSCGQRFYFHRGSATVRGTQVDTGGGGGSVEGLPRTFDFWNPPSGGGLARSLGLIRAGLATVAYSTRNCWTR